MKLRDWLNEQFISEASYGNANMEKAANLLASYLAKKHFGALHPYGGKAGYSEKYKKSTGNAGVGYRFISDAGKAVRIDFDASNRGQLSGVTVWETIKNDNPTTYITIPSMFNTIEACQYIIGTILQTGSVSSVQSLQEEIITEAPKPRPELHPSLVDSNKLLKRFAWDAERKFGIDLNGKTADEIKAAVKAIRSESAGQETTSRDEEVKTATSVLSAKKYADVDTIFEDLKDLVNMVVKGSQAGLLVTGCPGTGKTYTINNVIKASMGAEGSKWSIAKGKVTAAGLYAVLFANRHKLIVFDDSDSVFGDKDAVNILKAAIDSYDTRLVSWYTKSTQDVTNFSAEELFDYYEKVETAIKEGDPKVKLPNRFEFEGKIIFISNLEARQIDSAIKSRTFVLDITLKREDMLKRIESILPQLGGNMLDLKTKKEVLVELKSYEGDELITMRSLLKALKIRESGSARWKELIRKYV